jgi:XTP/dITP diphosphohydrolase
VARTGGGGVAGPAGGRLPPRIAIASRNAGKVREILAICADWPVAWVTDGDRGWPSVEETGVTYLENARLKAHAVAAVARVPAIADDSGIEVDALGGEPGPRSARFAGLHASDADNLALLIERIRAVPPSERTARYRCVAVCAWPSGREIAAEATCEGRLILEPRGSGGFGYDPIFVPTLAPGLGGGALGPDPQGSTGRHRTMAELAPEEKDAISHRGLAMRSLRRLMEAGAQAG